MQRLLVWTFRIHLGREERLDEEQGICCSWHSGWSVSCLAQEWSLAERTHKSLLLGTYVVAGQEPAQPSCEDCCWIEIGKWEGFSAGQGALPRWPLPPARAGSEARCSSPVMPGFICLFQQSLSHRKLEVEPLGEARWFVMCCSVWIALGNAGSVSREQCNEQSWCDIR